MARNVWPTCDICGLWLKSLGSSVSGTRWLRRLQIKTPSFNRFARSWTLALSVQRRCCFGNIWHCTNQFTHWCQSFAIPTTIRLMGGVLSKEIGQLLSFKQELRSPWELSEPIFACINVLWKHVNSPFCWNQISYFRTWKSHNSIPAFRTIA